MQRSQDAAGYKIGLGAAAAALAALPWLNPFAPGASATVVPWLWSMACGLALWLLTPLGGGRLRVNRWVLAALALATAWAVLPHLQLRPEILMPAAGILLVGLAAGFARARSFAQAVQAGMLAAAAVNAVIGLCQYFGIAANFSPWMNTAQAGDAFGNLRQPNQFASLCWIGGAILLFGTLRLPRWAARTLMVLLATAAAATVSRTGMVQGLALTLLAAWWPGEQRRSRLLLCALAAGAYMLATMLLPVLLEASTGALPARTLWARLGGGEGCGSRLVLWSNVLHLIALKPLAGWGWGELDFAHFDTLYPGTRFCDILDNAHNLPLHLAVELGVPAALVACGLALWWAWRQKPWTEGDPLRQLAWSLLALVLLHSMLEYPLWYGPFQIALGMALGWLAVGPLPEVLPSRAGKTALAGAVALAAAIGYAAWDYARVSQIFLPPEQRRPQWAEDTLAHVRRSWLFSGQAAFADLTLATPQRSNAEWMYALSHQVLHYSPEPRVIERAIESATYLGKLDEAVRLLARYRAAFPREYEAWRQAQKLPKFLPLQGAT